MLGVIIPARNEEQAIHLVIKNLFSAGIDAKNIFVIDNNSIDNTKKVALSFNVSVLECEQIGYQSALNKGLKYLKKNSYSKFLIVDGDNEITFQAINDAVKNANEYDLIVGSRSNIKRIGERIVNKWFYKLYGIKDIMCGLKLGNLAQFNSNNYLAFGMDLLDLSCINKKKLLNLPISLNPRNSSRLGNKLVVNIKLLIDLFRFLINVRVK